MFAFGKIWSIPNLVTGAYAVVIVVLAVFGYFGYIYKIAVLPALVLIALLAGRLRHFVRDWSVFLAALFLADAIRGLIYACINRFEWPVYMNYAIRWDQFLLGGSTMPEILQGAWFHPDRIGFLEKLLVIVHASHFVFFLFFAFILWLNRATHFARFQTAMLLTIYVGMIGYLLLPTVPPWMASEYFQAVGPIHHVSAEVYNYGVPGLERYFSTNPIAAMPSLHAAFPTVIALVGFRHFGWRAWPTAIYAGLVYLAVMYLGEHYLVDVVAGILVAIGCYLMAYRLSPVKAPRDSSAPFPGPERRPGLAFLTTVMLLLAAEASGLWAQNHFKIPYVPSSEFAARELASRVSPVSVRHELSKSRWLESPTSSQAPAVRSE